MRCSLLKGENFSIEWLKSRCFNWHQNSMQKARKTMAQLNSTTSFDSTILQEIQQ